MRDLPAMTGRTAGGQVFGARGDDYLDGGPGADNLYGDASVVGAVLDWTVRRTVRTSAGAATYTLDTAGLVLAGDLATSPGAADVIYAGTGADWVFAGAGDDYVEGGNAEGDANVEDDVLFGEAGNDVLSGGSGRRVPMRSESAAGALDAAIPAVSGGVAMTTGLGKRPVCALAVLGAWTLLLALLSLGVIAQEPPKPVPLPVEQMRALAYTKEFARRFRLPEPAPGGEPSGGLQAIEFFVEKGPPWTDRYYCVFKLYVDSSLPVAYPEPGAAGSKWLLVYSKHFFLWPDPDNRRWLSFSEADRRHHAERQSAYDGLAAIATPDYEFQKRGGYEDIGFDEYYRELFPGVSYIQLSAGCLLEPLLRRRPEWQLWLKKEGGRDYRRQLRIHSEDFVKFAIPSLLLARVLELSAQAERYNSVVREHEYKLQRERAARSGAQPK